jgi:hypothetical protein
MADAVVGNTNTVGATAAMLQHLIMNAGAVYSNYGTATEALMGATSGGCEFSVVPKTRDIAVDGVKDVFRGGTQITGVDVTLLVNFIEVTPTILQAALLANLDTTTNVGYTTLTATTDIEDDNYIDNIALVSDLSANDAPVIIIIYNALSEGGIKFANKDNADNLIPTTFTGHCSLDNIALLPFEIRYPDVSAS